MTQGRRDREAVFTPDHRLLLLQLRTRELMAERFSREVGSGAEDQGAASDLTPASIPPRWRLLPEDTTLHDWQRECLPRWLERGSGTVKVATGGGKTLFALAAAEELQCQREPDLRLVIVVPTIPLMFQWRDELAAGNLPAHAIGMMGGGQELPPPGDLRVLICVLASARDKLGPLVGKAQWAERMMLVVDECHRANAAQARQIFDSKARYTLGLSATPEQEGELEGIPTDEAYSRGVVGQALGPIIFEFTLKQSLAAGLLTPFEVWHVGLPLSPEEAVRYARLSREITDLRKELQIQHRRSRSRQAFIAWCQTRAHHGGPGSSDAERFIGLANRRKLLLYRADTRRQVTLGMLRDAVADPDSRAIVFHESIAEIEEIFLAALEAGLPAVLEHSQLPEGLRAENIEAFRQGVARVIISARSLVEGFNVPSADIGVIAASTSSVRQRIQSLGRMLRRKPGGRAARIAVLYVRDTEDEALYERADWENVIGAERSRYFHWDPGDAGASYPDGLSETNAAPRRYRPPSWEVDPQALRVGDEYPGQARGVDLRVDHSGNLRTADGGLVPAPSVVVASVLERNPLGRARVTPAGHLITRIDGGKAAGQDWRYLGTIELPVEPVSGQVIRLRLKSTSGRRVIAREDEKRRNVVRFALGPGSASEPSAGEVRDRLLTWVRAEESRRGVVVAEIFWDGATSYWLEVAGERVSYPEDIGSLEFGR